MKNKKLNSNCRPSIWGLRWALISPMLICAFALQAQTKYVTMTGSGLKNGTSWANAIDSVHFPDDVISATSGTVFWIAGGVYYPDLSSSTYRLSVPPGVKLYGGFAGTETTLTQRNIKTNITVLSGKNSSKIIITMTNADSTTIIDGITIRDANGRGGIYLDAAGGSVSSPIISNCIFLNNYNTNGGGAINCDGQGGTASPTIINCLFIGNSAGNNGGAILANGAFSGFSDIKIINCVFVHNYAKNGGAIYNDGYFLGKSNCTAINCTFVNNKADTAGAIFNAALAGGSAKLILANCILWNDTGTSNASEIFNFTATAIVNYSDIKGGWAGTNNINLDPKFVSATNLALKSISPCINAGDTNSLPKGITTDIAGNPRLIGGRVDMGAYETGGCVPITNTSITPNTSNVCKGGSKMFKLNGTSGGPIQWQYNSNTGANSLTWTNFGIANKDTATLLSIMGTVYVRAILSNACSKLTSTTDAIVTLSDTIRLSVSNIKTSTATATFTSVVGASKYSAYLNGALEGTTSTTTYTLTGLTAGSFYNLYMKPDSAACMGTGGKSNTVRFNTLPTTLSLMLTAGKGNTIVASWKGNTSYKYKLYVGYTSSLPNYNVYNVEDTTFTITNNIYAGQTMISYLVLDSGATSSIKPQSNYVYYKVPGTVCSATSPTITSQSSGSRSITFSWSGSSSSYQVFFKNVINNNWNNTPTTANTITFNGLPPNSCFEVYVVNRCSTSPVKLGYSSTIDTICTQSLCSAPLNLILSAPTCHGFSATWNAVNGVTQYAIYWSKIVGSTVSLVGNYISTTNSFTFGTDLASGTKYNVYVKAINCSGSNSITTASNIETITTSSVGCKDDNLEIYPGNQNGLTIGTFNIYPNPSHGEFTMDLMSTNTMDNGYIRLFNLMGQVVYQTTVSNNNGLIHTALNNTSLATGVYFLKVQIGVESHIARIVIQK